MFKVAFSTDDYVFSHSCSTTFLLHYHQNHGMLCISAVEKTCDSPVPKGATLTLNRKCQAYTKFSLGQRRIQDDKSVGFFTSEICRRIQFSKMTLSRPNQVNSLDTGPVKYLSADTWLCVKGGTCLHLPADEHARLYFTMHICSPHVHNEVASY